MTVGPVVALAQCPAHEGTALARSRLPAARRKGRLPVRAPRPRAAYRRTAAAEACGWTWAASPRATRWTRRWPRFAAAGITRMMVEAGGNIGLGDPPPEKPGWRIGIAPPDVRSPPRQYLWLSRVAISTSGDLWQYATIGGVRYSHLIDPRTGMALPDQAA